jgi:DNA-binding response OmpR family regulator
MAVAACQVLDLGFHQWLDVCREIHQLDPGIDIIMLTARDEELTSSSGSTRGRRLHHQTI